MAAGMSCAACGLWVLVRGWCGYGFLPGELDGGRELSRQPLNWICVIPGVDF